TKERPRTTRDGGIDYLSASAMEIRSGRAGYRSAAGNYRATAGAQRNHDTRRFVSRNCSSLSTFLRRTTKARNQSELHYRVGAGHAPPAPCAIIMRAQHAAPLRNQMFRIIILIIVFSSSCIAQSTFNNFDLFPNDGRVWSILQDHSPSIALEPLDLGG